jgi:16S rRNA (uracil1498-N3)-methyltransferase
MPRFFLPPDAFAGRADGGSVTIVGDDARHISLALRMRVGDVVTLCDGKGMEYDGTLLSLTPTAVEVEISAPRTSTREMPVAVTLYQGLAKGDKMDTIIQKAVELGVSRIVPVTTARCIMKMGDNADKKIARWQKIANEAAGQCGRGVLPLVTAPVSFREAVAQASADELSLFCYEELGKTKALSALLPETSPQTLSFFVGPEGGFDPREAEMAEEAGVKLCGLGPRILRTETASGYVLAALSVRYE